MNKFVLAIAGIYFLQSCLAAPTESNMIDIGDKSTTLDAELAPDVILQPAADIIGALYRRAMAKALHEKVSDLQTKLLKGENAIPAAIDILRYALFSNQAKDAVKKITDHVLGMMSPEMKQNAIEDGLIEITTTPMSKVNQEKP